ncbi:hypothetical protein KIN20_024874 [Parelaphostrongylus tenuis]|uniref:Uncharacterized protein n=1 Tax=Parelaphostrongylus tenuis TaxID=148309 RepID=A0AAD5QTY8_PARTN|nr:hypothetical protein KIN20_024874 [Parelaphostrongylus tenuis]
MGQIVALERQGAYFRVDSINNPFANINGLESVLVQNDLRLISCGQEFVSMTHAQDVEKVRLDGKFGLYEGIITIPSRDITKEISLKD